MNRNEFFDILKDPGLIGEEHLQGLEEIISLFPYFQAVRVLHLKLLKKKYSFRYNRFLRITAAYTPDRSVLFDYIVDDALTSPENVSAQLDAVLDIELVDETVLYRLEHAGEGEGELPGLKLIEDQADEPVEVPVTFEIEDKHTFFEWLRLSGLKPIDRDKPAPPSADERQKKREIIDRFIIKNPKIKRPVPGDDDFEEPPDIAVNKIFMTETLARLYEKQGKIQEAIKAYEILSLKIPEKSGFFADQIKRLKEHKTK